MSNPVIELKRLLGTLDTQTSGVITEVLRNGTYRVRTPKSTLEVKAVGGQVFLVNDEVIVRNGLIQGGLRKSSTIPTYRL